MKSAHRRMNGRWLALGAALTIAMTTATLRAATLSAISGKTNQVRVHPAPDSVLEFDAPQILAVENALSATLRQNPSCLAGKVGDALDVTYRDLVGEVAFPPDYIMKWVVDHWEHWCVNLTEFDVDFGSQRIVQVLVEQSELKN